jgi:hypothetical protein
MTENEYLLTITRPSPERETLGATLPNPRSITISGTGTLSVLTNLVSQEVVLEVFPSVRLSDAERALLEDDQLRNDTIEALRAAVRGEGVSSDWLFSDDE